MQPESLLGSVKKIDISGPAAAAKTWGPKYAAALPTQCRSCISEIKIFKIVARDHLEFQKCKLHPCDSVIGWGLGAMGTRLVMSETPPPNGK